MAINESWHDASVLIVSAEEFLYPSRKGVYVQEQAVPRCARMSLFLKKKSAEVLGGL